MAYTWTQTISPLTKAEVVDLSEIRTNLDTEDAANTPSASLCGANYSSHNAATYVHYTDYQSTYYPTNYPSTCDGSM